MPQNNDFKVDSPTVSEVFNSIGVFSDENSNNSEMVGAFYDTNPAFQGLYIVMPSGDIKYFDIKITDIVTANNGELAGFQDASGSYVMRTLTSDDGQWASKYKIDLPVEVLEQKVVFDSKQAFEKLFNITLPQDNADSFGEDLVVYYDESNTVSGLVYSCIAGYYSLSGANWVQEDMNDGIYEGDYVAEVNPDKAQQVVDAYYESRGLLDVDKISSLLLNNEDTSIIDSE